MATLTVVTPTVAGVNPSAVSAAGGGDQAANPNGRLFLLVTNGGVGSINVTLAAVKTGRPGDGMFPPMTLGNQVVAVTNGQSRIIGPIPPAFNDTSNNVQITYSGVTSVTIAAFEAA